MNKILRATLPVFLLGIFACEPMKVDQADATIADLPSDFDVQAYLAINPDVTLPSIKDAAARFNKSLTWDSLALKNADDSAFAADSAQVKWLITTFTRSHLDTIDIDSLGNIDFPCISGNCAANYIKAVKDYNFQQESDDLSKYQEVLSGLDSVGLAEYHYRAIGRYDGHPYKYCGTDKGDARNTTSQPIVTYTPQKTPIYNYSAYTYCLDQANGGIYMNKEQK